MDWDVGQMSDAVAFIVTGKMTVERVQSFFNHVSRTMHTVVYPIRPCYANSPKERLRPYSIVVILWCCFPYSTRSSLKILHGIQLEDLFLLFAIQQPSRVGSGKSKISVLFRNVETAEIEQFRQRCFIRRVSSIVLR